MKVVYISRLSNYLNFCFIRTCRIGSEKRPEKQHYIPPTPGPGSYQLNMTDMGKNGPKYSASKRPSQFVKESPGPNAYQPDA